MHIKPLWIAVAGVVLLMVYMYSMRGIPSRHIWHPRYYGYEGFAGATGESSTFTMFGTDWCGHCKKALPEFKALGPTVTTSSSSIATRFVNPELDPQAAVGYEISGYPTFYLDTGSQRLKYSGPRTTAGFLAFLQSS